MSLASKLHAPRLITRGVAALAILAAFLTADLTRAGEPRLRQRSSEWLQWGGPGRDFKVPSGPLATHWPEKGPPRIWSRTVGSGYSSVLVDDASIYVMSRREDEEIVSSLSARTGETEWEFAYESRPSHRQTVSFGRGPNATPLIIGNRIYTVGFTGLMHCLDRRRGKLLWKKDLVKEFGSRLLRFGYSSSPVQYGRLVVVLVGGEKNAAVGFDRVTGEVRWRTSPLDISYSSPFIIDADGEAQLVFMGPEQAAGIDMLSGSVRWTFPHRNQFENNCAGPWWDGKSRLVLSSQGEAGSRTLELSREGETTLVREIMSTKRMGVLYGSALLLDGHLYGAAGKELKAMNIEDGSIAWSRAGYPEASLLHADGKLLVLDDTGLLTLARFSPEGLEVLARSRVVDKPAWTSPTLVGTRLYVRGADQLVALELGEVDGEE